MSNYLFIDDSGSPLNVKIKRAATAHFVRSGKPAESIRIPAAEFIEEYGDVEEVKKAGCTILPGHEIQKNYIESAGE